MPTTAWNKFSLRGSVKNVNVHVAKDGSWRLSIVSLSTQPVKKKSSNTPTNIYFKYWGFTEIQVGDELEVVGTLRVEKNTKTGMFETVPTAEEGDVKVIARALCRQDQEHVVSPADTLTGSKAVLEQSFDDFNDGIPF